MSYQALYRVWRPQSFDELVGQEMIAQTLRHAIQNQQLSHAYLFAGPRGTGKTSAAKILSKAVNCPYASEGNPCNECEICRGITSGDIADVIEIDAASNNGVDEIRDLRDKARYTPTVAAYKVYIIDEVHMLSTGAFNALLKTLEEPPEQVLFILATTEPHKIPATILSRTQRFDFQRIKDQAIVDRMAYILDHDQVQYQEEGLAIIARAANGGMRDALSLLDQALSYDNQAVTTKTALLVSGSFAQQVYVDYLLAVYKQEVAEALEILDQQLQAGKQGHRFIEELVLFIRDVLVSQFAGDNQTLLSDSELEPLMDQVPAFYYYQLIDHLNRAQQQMRLSNQPDVYLQVMTVQIAQGQVMQPPSKADPELEPTNDTALVEQLQEQLTALQQQVKGQGRLIEDLRNKSTQETPQEDSHEKAHSQQQSEEPLVPRQRPDFAQADYQLDMAKVYHVLNQAGKDQLTQLKEQWTAILQALTPVQRVKLPRTSPIAAGEEAGLIAFEDRQFCAMVYQDQGLQDQLNNVASQHLGRNVQLVYLTQEEWPRIRQEYKERFAQYGGKPVPAPGSSQETKEASNAHSLGSFGDSAPTDQVTSEQAFRQEESEEVNKEERILQDESDQEENQSASREADSDRRSSQANNLFAQSQERSTEADDQDQAASIRQAPGQLGMFEETLDTASSKASEKDPLIDKAFDLFGQENVTVHYEE